MWKDHLRTWDQVFLSSLIILILVTTIIIILITIIIAIIMMAKDHLGTWEQVFPSSLQPTSCCKTSWTQTLPTRTKTNYQTLRPPQSWQGLLSLVTWVAWLIWLPKPLVFILTNLCIVLISTIEWLLYGSFSWPRLVAKVVHPIRNVPFLRTLSLYLP